jgi:hypothetical protein
LGDTLNVSAMEFYQEAVLQDRCFSLFFMVDIPIRALLFWGTAILHCSSCSNNPKGGITGYRLVIWQRHIGTPEAKPTTKPSHPKKTVPRRDEGEQFFLPSSQMNLFLASPMKVKSNEYV